MAGSSLKAALLANFAIGVIKLIVATITRSGAMLSEAIHSFADSFNQVLLALGIRRSKKEPDLDHPFGYSKVQFFWSFVVAVLIFGISGTLAFRHGWDLVVRGHELETDLIFWNIIVLVVAIILEAMAFRQAYRETKEFQEKYQSESIFEALEDMQNPVLLSLLVEDSLAILGLVIALIGTLLTFYLHNPVIDGVTSMIIGVVLMAGGLLLARENKRYLVGKAVAPHLQEAIISVLDESKQIEEVRAMRTMLMGSDKVLLALDIHFTDEVRKEEGGVSRAIDELEVELSKLEKLSPDTIFIEAQ